MGRPDIGGSGSPASSTSRAVDAAGGAPELGTERPDEGERAPTLPDASRGGVAESGLAAPLVAVALDAAAAVLTLPTAGPGGGVAETVPLVEPAWAPVGPDLGRTGPSAAASGAG